MRRFAIQAAETRNRLLTEVSLETGIAAAIIEKDFWVCWILGCSSIPHSRGVKRWCSREARRCRRCLVRSGGFLRTLICRWLLACLG
jgi:hypothetical protein